MANNRQGNITTMRYQGIIVTAEDKPFGFIYCVDLKRRVFYHQSEVHGVNPKVGDELTFELGPSKTPGKLPVATKMEYLPAPELAETATKAGV